MKTKNTLQTPADDAPAEEWGALAVSIPGWRWPWTCSHTEVCPPMPGYVWLEGAWCYTDDISPVARWSRIPAIPDPDHWAWWGWVIHLLQPVGFGAGTDEDGTCGVSLWETDENGNSFEGASINIGRAGIATAAAYGRWPGGGK